MAWLACCGAVGTRAVEPIDVWLDVDTSTGITDVDDGLAMIQAFHSPELRVRGISTVYGNAPLIEATRIAREIVEKFGPDLQVHPGASSATGLGEDTDAVRALAAELSCRPLTILALGPATNVATLVKRHPELSERIVRIVLVAARRRQQRFVSSDWQKLPHRDFNFENDPAAMQVLLESPIELVFAPWEVSSHVWIDRNDLESLRGTGGSGAWIAETSGYWIELWERSISKQGFNPFDTLAVGYLTHPELIESMRMGTRIEEAQDDRDPRQRKPYLFVEPRGTAPRTAIYCYRPKPAFKAMLLARLAGPGNPGK
jgi:pyrimidine-specific ribonucleoside hydrolase